MKYQIEKVRQKIQARRKEHNDEYERRLKNIIGNNLNITRKRLDLLMLSANDTLVCEAIINDLDSKLEGSNEL